MKAAISRITEQSQLDAIVPLYHAYRSFYGLNKDQLGVEHFLTARIKQADTILFVAYNADQPVGFIQLFPSFSIYNLGRYYILNDLFVDEAHRGQSIASQLIQAAKDFVKSQKGRGMMLETALDNQVAQKLYLRQGFKPMTEVVFMGWENTDTN